jgi:hypothetical protein
MKILRRIYRQLVRYHRDSHLVLEPEQLRSKTSERRIVLFGSRCVVLHSEKDLEPAQKNSQT